MCFSDRVTTAWRWNLWVHPSFCTCHLYTYFVPVTYCLVESAEKLSGHDHDMFDSWLDMGMPTTHPEESIDVGLAASPVYASTIISVPQSFKRRSIPRATKPQHLMLFLLHLCGDIELNPGPAMADDTCACGYCQLRVSWHDLAVCCDDCGVWFHKTCQSIPSAEFSNTETVRWECYRSNTINHNNNTFHSYELMS